MILYFSKLQEIFLKIESITVECTDDSGNSSKATHGDRDEFVYNKKLQTIFKNQKTFLYSFYQKTFLYSS